MRTVPLEQICDIQIGRTPSRSVSKYWGGDLPWATISDFAAGRTVVSTKEMITEVGAEETGSKLVPKGTLLLSFKLSLGKRAFAGCDLYTNEAIAALRIRDATSVDKQYLYWALGSIDYDKHVDRAAKGKTLNKAKLSVLEVPLPSLPEQKRIANILDSADLLRAARRESILELDRLLRATFLDRFGDPVNNPKRLPVTTLGEAAMRVTDGTHQSPKWSKNGIPFLFVSNIRDRQIDLETSKFISEAEHARLTAHCPIEVGDILYTTVGSYGNPAMVREGLGRFAFQRHIAHIKPKPQLLDSQFLEVMLDSPAGRYQADRLARGVAQKTLNLRELKSFKILVPPLGEQRRFAAIVDTLQRQRAHARAHLAEMDTLFSCLQSRAFGGRL